MKNLVFSLIAGCLFAWSAGNALGAVAAPDPVFDVPALLATPLNPQTLKTSEKDGIVTEEIRFHSETDGTNRVDIFAFFSYPKGGTNLPAFVWNQGGLYQATTYWTEFGAKRGYAVLCIDFPIPGYRSSGGYNITSEIVLPADPRQAPIYHGAVALLKAVSYLESRTGLVDASRIGMAGSSWGGFYTTLMIGVDRRLKAGSAMFGCGGLSLGCAWFRGVPKDAAWAERWRTTLDPAWRLPQTTAPINWSATSNDTFYWMPGLMESYARAGGPKHLVIMPNWDHALTPALDEEVFVFLDQYLQGKPALDDVTPLVIRGKGKNTEVQWEFHGPRPVQAAELYLSYGDAGNWHWRYWGTLPATINGQQCTVRLPTTALPYYIVGSITDTNGFRSATPMLRVDPAAYGLLDKRAVPVIDGAAEWGDFEAPQIEYLKLHGYAQPPLSPDAHSGKQAAVISGRVAMPPLRFAAGVPHRLTLFLKSDKPAQVTVVFNETADGQTVSNSVSCVVTTAWTAQSVAFTPLNGMGVQADLTVTTPPDAKVLLDTVTLRATGAPAP